MFKIESYVTPILLSYVDKYVRDFKPADAQVSLWGGGVALHNLVLKADVLQREVALPFTLVSGRIHELLIQVPWTKIMSEPIVVTIDTIECVLSLNPPSSPDGSPPSASQSRKTQMVEAPPGYMQALVRRIVSNIALRVHHLIVKYVQDDIVLSLNVKHLAVDSAGPNWEAAFAEIDQNQPVIRRLVRLDDLTLCLDKSDLDGKIRFFQEPLLYRCQLDLRVLTRLVSANTRRATSLNVQLRSAKLAWSVTNDQLILLLRLIRERPVTHSPTPAPKQTLAQTPMHAISANSAEPARSESWSEWAWSWLPTWMDREGGVEEAPVPATPLPIYFNAYLDDISLVFKVMQMEANNRKRSRSILELSANYAALKSSICTPTSLRVRFGAREILLSSQGKCVCGHLDLKASNDEPTVYLQRTMTDDLNVSWTWPEEDFNEKVETAEAADENYTEEPTQSGVPEGDPVTPLEASEAPQQEKPERNDADELWAAMSPLLFVEFVHERLPPSHIHNPYENPPKNFEYSDWVEQCTMTVLLEPVEMRLCMGLIHRLIALKTIYREQPHPDSDKPEPPMRVLTVEENESLSDNLPQKRITIDTRGVIVRVIPWSHLPSDRPTPASLVLVVDLPKTSTTIVSPLYPHRVCSAACQMPVDSGPLWQGARRHVTLNISSIEIHIADPANTVTRPCARADIRLVTHQLLHKEYFEKRDSIEFSYHLKIKEVSICGSAARLQAAYYVPLSLYNERRPIQLKHTTLPKDALYDEDAVAIDLNLEDFTMRGYVTKNVNTHVISLQSAKATALHEPKSGEIKQAWLFSAPDSPTTTPYLRMAIQWCTGTVDNSFDYMGVWTEPLAMSVDPLFISWLAYKPTLKADAPLGAALKSMSSQLNLRRRSIPQSSARGSRPGSGPAAELVHVRSRSHASSSEPSEKNKVPPIPVQPKISETWFNCETLVMLHKRMKNMLINVEMGLVLVYVTMSSASAIDCVTLRDAMERHASEAHRVVAISLGRLSVHSSSATKQLWQILRHDGPTFVKSKPQTESFPWKIGLADVSCYTLEVHLMSQEKAGVSSGLKSRLKVPGPATPKTVLELVTTSVTVSVVTKSVQYKNYTKKQTKKATELSTDEKKMKYFTTGMEFKPTSLKEFVRGPSGRKGKNSKEDTLKSDIEMEEDQNEEDVTVTDGPVVSLGVHLHADTPPIIIRLEQDQIHKVAAAVHCFTHIHTLLKRAPISILKQTYNTLGSSHRTLVRSVSENEELPSYSEDTSDNQSELISIFDRAVQNKRPLKTFFWFQWVISRATLVVASKTVKLALDIDDVICTVDIQAQYNQLKIKLASATIKHYERSETDQWTAGVLGGRVMEAREPTDAKEDAHFLAVTFTQAQISNLPASWKEELHPKLLENNSMDSLWEVYAMLAPLEVIIQPSIMENVMSLVREMSPRAFCPLKSEIENTRSSSWQWPFCYITAGGIRLLVTGAEQGKDNYLDDTFILSIGKVQMNPHPENPICRRAVNAGPDGGWMTPSGGFEGRQYEIQIKGVSVRSGQFKKLILAEANEDLKKGTARDNNPAFKWSKQVEMPLIVPILHTVELCCVLAPALYVGGSLTCGPALEVNLVSDCSIELSISQLVLVRQLLEEFNTEVHRGTSSSMRSSGRVDKNDVCPYAPIILKHVSDKISPNEMALVESFLDNRFHANESTRSMTYDSGVETGASSSKTRMSDEQPFKKSVSITFVEQIAEASHFLEVFVMMGVVDLSLYVADDGSPEIVALRPPYVEPTEPVVLPTPQNVPKEEKTEENILKRDKESVSQINSRSLTEMVREDAGQDMLEIQTIDHARKFEGNIPLLQVTLFQPNLYYWKRKSQKTIQISLFNIWVALGVGDIAGQWHAVLLATAKGVSDPVTDIPPALATLKVIAPIPTASTTNLTSSGARGTVRLDIERPVQLDLSADKLRRLKGIYRLLQENVLSSERVNEPPSAPILYKWRTKLTRESIESITIHTSQISVCGSEGTVGWDSSSLQLAASARPERLNARALVTALLVAAGPPGDRRHVVLHPLMLGMELEASWEAWRRAEGGMSVLEPSIKVDVEVDTVTFDFRPAELAAVQRLRESYYQLFERGELESGAPRVISSVEMVYKSHASSVLQSSTVNLEHVFNVTLDSDATNHFYKDDLRSGAFKILSGGQLPMAYQVMLHGNAVSWRYPHPRAITRVVVFPLPGQNKEIDCVLELFISMLGRWEPHTYFKLPVGEPRELNLYVPPPDAVFSIMWRFRTCNENEQRPPPYEFNVKRFVPRADPLVVDSPEEVSTGTRTQDVTAEQLSGVLRVDSYFAPRLLPRVKIVARVAHLHVHLHNSLPQLNSTSNYLEGYYVSKPLTRTHRVLSLKASDISTHAHLGSSAGILYAVNANVSCDMVDCGTGTMEGIVEEFRLQSGVSDSKSYLGPRTRVITSGIHLALQIPRLRTLQALATDWTDAYREYILNLPPSILMGHRPDYRKHSNREIAAATAVALEGRVALWLHNSCGSAMRVGQEGTDEVVPLGPGAALAYRWRSPTAPKRLRLALASPTADWHWSSSVPFTAGLTSVKLNTPESLSGKQSPSMTAFVHVKVEESGASRFMHISGRLVLANMLRTALLYKVRSHSPDTTQWKTMCSGELATETVGHSVVCSADCEMVLKIKSRTHNTGWSGDIPLKECPKENVPWLVKVPAEGDAQFVSVWCRVVRGRSDGRILATLWPLYVLHSHLPLDTDVLIVTESTTMTTEDLTPMQLRPPPLLQTTPGRGTSTHLLAPGTTSARHNLSFQYRNIECPVTREAVPLHYGVTDTSVFDKRTPVMNIEDVINDISRWLERSGRNAVSKWPYSVVSKHWPGDWIPASIQPRCDVTVRYQAVRAGGGCSLEILLCPVALLCNASPISLTLRAYDAAPLCKLDPGTAISPPISILKKPFFMSMEMGRETFVSSQLQVSSEEPGRYGSPAPGHVTLDHAAHFAILCNQKVALLTLYYEIKEQINVLGLSSSYVLINRLDTSILVSAIAVPNDIGEDITLRPKTFKVVLPNKEENMHGTALRRFWLRNRWRGGDPSELRTYLCLSLPAKSSTPPPRAPVPIRLGEPPVRRAVALVNEQQKSIPIVVTQMKQDHRCVVVVSHDPCPQFLVHNHTSLTFAVAQPQQFADEPSTSHTEVKQECLGARWWCMLPPGSVIHYSTPAHCYRYPPDPMSVNTTNMPFLTFAKGRDETMLEWSSPVVAADGEHLLQYSGGVTIKLRVRTHPHSTLLELQDVDQNDISASDIRRRLIGAFTSNPIEEEIKRNLAKPPASLERVDANSMLLNEDRVHERGMSISSDHGPQEGSSEHSDRHRRLTEELSTVRKKVDTSTVVLFVEPTKERVTEMPNQSSPFPSIDPHFQQSPTATYTSSQSFKGVTSDSDFSELDGAVIESERFRCVIACIAVELSASIDVKPLLALHLDRTALLVLDDDEKTKTIISIADAQIDNLQYDSGQFDFAVVASTRSEALQADRWPPLWNMFAERDTFTTRQETARLLMKLQHDKWNVVSYNYRELTEVEIKLGTLALYVEDAYVKGLVELFRLLVPARGGDAALGDERALQAPLRLRLLHVHPLDLTLTLHTAVRMYIALDQSPLRLSAFKLHDMMSSAERLTHALTVHYLSAAILGAGWVVGGLELLGAPGALAARLGGATGGVRGVASATAAALLRSLSAWAGSLARNLDLLAGDEEHARRAAAARRRPPPSFVAGLMAGITNFAINILGAVGGLAHHPLVGVAVGESESGATALRRGLLGALTKPLSATADLVAYAGTGLLRQTGWDPVPQPRRSWAAIEARTHSCWHRDCVRWTFRLCEITALAGFEVLLENAPLLLLLTHKFLVVADPETERIVEMIDLRFCTLGPYQGPIIELCVMQRRQSKSPGSRAADEDDEYQISAAAMARVARYTGTQGGSQAEMRVLSLLPPPGRSHALHAALAAALHHNADSHFPIL